MNFSLSALSLFRNFRLGTKILSLPIIVSVFFLVTGAFTYWEFQRISAEMVVVTEKQAPEANAVTRLLINVLEKQKLIEYYMRTKEADSIGVFEVLQLQSEEIIADLLPVLYKEEHKKILNTFLNHQSIFDDLFLNTLVPMVNNSGNTLVNEQVKLSSEGKELISEALRLQQSVWSALDETSIAINNDINEGVTVIIFMTIIATVLGLMLAIIVTRGINRGVNTAVSVANKIADDDWDTVITADSYDEIGQLLNAFKAMQANLKERIENERVISAENARVKQALGAVTTNVMVADANNTIVYMNDSVTNMFNEAASDIRKDLPNFNEKRLMGSNMDQFHKHPAHQQRIIDELKDTYRAQLEIGGRTFSLVATPVFGDDDERLGTAVEWQDRTAEVAVEREVESVVDSVANGDLSQRLALQGKTGFLKNISEAINQLTTVCDTVTKDTIRVFSALARGDLTETIETEYQGAFEQLKSDANTTISKFIEVIDEIQKTSASVNTGASEISAGNQSLSQRNEEQASSLEETASSMEEMTSTVRQNADNANQANQLATEVSNQAELGGDVVGNAVKAMEEINTSSKKVADIISVIDEIAFQTNLLALNAAVEAARAGEQGRGFAVVASEVRNLAQRSAGAAKEIKELIKDSVQKVSEGSELVNASGETLEEIVAGIKKVSDIVADIATASVEQASGIEQVNRAITQLDDMTQQNAALVEQAAASSEAMQGQAESVGELMAFFNTGVKRQSADSNDVSAARTGNTETRNRPTAMLGTASTPKARVKPEVPPHDDEWEEF